MRHMSVSVQRTRQVLGIDAARKMRFQPLGLYGNYEDGQTICTPHRRS